MSVETITSVKNPLVASLRALKTAKARRETGSFLVEGETMLNEALSSGLVPRALLTEAETPLAARFPEARLVTRGVLEAVCDTKTPQGMCAAFELPPPRALSDAPRMLVALDGVQDPGNVGTIWRTADAAGLGGLLLGASRPVAAEFTFFLAIPVMFGASALKVVKYLLEGMVFTGEQLAVLGLGCAVAYVVSVGAIGFLMNFVKKHDFKVFGWYRIALGIVVLAAALLGL